MAAKKKAPIVDRVGDLLATAQASRATMDHDSETDVAEFDNCTTKCGHDHCVLVVDQSNPEPPSVAWVEPCTLISEAEREGYEGTDLEGAIKCMRSEYRRSGGVFARSPRRLPTLVRIIRA
jgi:hypothetical protein